MFVIGEAFADLTLRVGVAIDDKVRVLDRADLQLGGAGHVARLLKRAGAKSVRLLIAGEMYCKFLRDIPNSCDDDYPMRVTLVENGELRRFIQPVYQFGDPIIRLGKPLVPSEALDSWMTADSNWVYICSHDYVDLRPILSTLQKCSDAPRVYFVSGGFELLQYKFNGRCYFFINRHQLGKLGYRFDHLDATWDAPETLENEKEKLISLWQQLRSVNDVTALCVTLDKDGVITVGLPPEHHYLYCIAANSDTPDIVWYASRVKRLVDATGCGDAFMVGFSMNLHTTEPVRAALMAARHCAQYVGTAYV